MRKKEQGFTLIEIIVVIIMIGVLAAIAVPIYTGYIYKARSSEAITTLGAVKTFMLERRMATGEWPKKGSISEPGTLLYEFNGFNELYYFSSFDSDIIFIINDDKVTIGLTADDNNFGLSKNYQGDKTVKIHFSYHGEKGDNYWSGSIVQDYASHLPQK